MYYHAVAAAGSVILAEGSGAGVTNVYGVLVALIGMAGVLGSALIIQIFSSRRAASVVPVAHDDSDEVASLYRKIGRLEGQLEACKEGKRRGTRTRTDN